jgi:formylglycine-generating enzyme required for sulfatase activity
MISAKMWLVLTFVVLRALLPASTATASEGEEETEEKEAGQVVTNSIGMELRRIEPGTFLMGSETGDPDEKPLHRVTITKPFYIGVHEVTQEQYAAVTGENPSRIKAAKRPVESVSWEEATAFCLKLSKMENAQYRLPTEAEWEYACRAGSSTVFHWGDSFNTSYFWCGYNSADGSRQVGKTKPNAWGLYDMSGNVWEWCEDWYADDAYSSTEDSDPKGPQAGTRRVIRGGSWWGTPEDCRSANRLSYRPAERLQTVGFRVCKVSP